MNALAIYLRLEAAMLLLDGVADDLADKVRDRMDPIWLKLSPHDLAWLSSRTPKGL